MQQEHRRSTRILGSLATASWSDVAIILPYAVVAAALLLAHRRLLDVLRSARWRPPVWRGHQRLRLTVSLILGTAAAVAVSGPIGFVGIIIPHIVRLTAGRATGSCCRSP